MPPDASYMALMAWDKCARNIMPTYGNADRHYTAQGLRAACFCRSRETTIFVFDWRAIFQCPVYNAKLYQT